MSSKEKARQPKCTRCRHHGLVVPQKGHAKRCPFIQCGCWKCGLISERTRINALQRQLLHRDTATAAGQAHQAGPEQLQTGQQHQEHQGQEPRTEQEHQDYRTQEHQAGQPDRAAQQPVPGPLMFPVPGPVPWGAGGAESGSGSAESRPRESGPPVALLHPPCSAVLVHLPWPAAALPPLIVSHLPPGAPHEPGPPLDSRPFFLTFYSTSVPSGSHHQEALSRPPLHTEEDPEREIIID